VSHVQLTAMLDNLVTDWSRERPDLDIAHKEIVYAIHIARSLLTRNTDEVLDGWKLNFNSFGVLATLRRSGKPFAKAPSELAQSLGFTAGGMSNLLNRLERLDYIRRERSTEDGRSVRVRLTSLGRSVVDEATTALTRNEAQHLKGLSATDQRRLYKSLRTIIDSFANPPVSG